MRGNKVMYVIKEDIFAFHNSAYAIGLPTNSSYRDDGTAIASDEVTKEFGKRYPDFEQELGDKLCLYGNDVFYFINSNSFSFPDRNRWFDKPDLKIIERSCVQLKNHPEYLCGRPLLMPKVGCYVGGAKWEDVESLLEYYLPEILIITKE